ncbi:MAG: globin [Pseudomonadota bacterium]
MSETTATADTAETITAAMMLLAERAGDVTPTVMDHYFERCADSKALMEHMDRHMLGRMMDQVLLLLMEPGEDELESYLEFETANHRAYGVQQHMYENLLSTVREVVANALGNDYTPATAAAFEARSSYLLEAIAAKEASH